MDRHFRRPLPHRFIPFPSLESPFRVWSGNLKWNSPRCGAQGWGRPPFSPTPTCDAMPSISIAEELAKKQREISVSEFFERNKQILGYDSPTKALLTVVKEGVENSLDATEEAEVLPDVLVEVNKVDKDEFLVVIEDNGPGIVKKEVPNVFGRLLYGSRFHARRQSLHPDEPIAILRDGRFELVPIRYLGERHLEDGEDGSLPVAGDIFAPCFSRKT